MTDKSNFDHFEFECMPLDTAGQKKQLNDGTSSYKISGKDIAFDDINKDQHREDLRFYSTTLRELLKKRHGPQCRQGMLFKHQENRILVEVTKIAKDGSREPFRQMEFWINETKANSI